MGESSGPLAEDIRKSPCNQSAETLYVQAMDYGCDVSSLEFAQRMDQDDSLRHFRQMFYYPKSATLPNGVWLCIYIIGILCEVPVCCGSALQLFYSVGL